MTFVFAVGATAVVGAAVVAVRAWRSERDVLNSNDKRPRPPRPRPDRRDDYGGF
jgi:hypothetical protein